MNTWRSYALPLILLAAGLALIGAYALRPHLWPQSGPPPTPTYTPEPIIPTRTPLGAPAADTAVTAPPLTTPAAPTAVFTPPAAALAPDTAVPYRARFGAAGGIRSTNDALQADLPLGAFINWNVALEPPLPGVEFWQMVRLDENGIRRTTWEEIEQIIAANPGAFWVVGNEPDVRWQDNVTPQRYAALYHEVYTFIKQRDPGAHVVIGGVSQSTPLRRAYLDIVLDTYQAAYGTPMPVDVWNVHAFILREEADSWGVGIPPGMDGAAGILYEIDDHADMAIFRQNLLDFRAWMADRGYGDRPLVITEYGILLPEDYGFPPEVVADFLAQSFDFFLTAVDATGYPADNGRLVQWWFWYSVYDDGLYPTGNLYDPAAGQLTLIGEAFARYAAGQ
jgi:hypothetical protein